MPGYLAGLLWWVCAALPAGVAAQAAQARRPATASASGAVAQALLLLRPGGSVRSAYLVGAQHALARAFAELGFEVTVSPLAFEDAQMLIGCTRGVRACGRQVAETLDSEQLVIPVLEEAAAGDRGLRLFFFESGGAVHEERAELPGVGEPFEPALRVLAGRVARVDRTAAAEAPAHAELASVASHGPPEEPPTDSAPARSSASARRERTLRVGGWTALGVGSSLLVGALATSLAARGAQRDYAQSDVRSREDADRALAHYDDATRRSEAARVLWGVGAGTAAVGAFALLWQHFVRGADRNLHPLQSPVSGERRNVRWGAVAVSNGVSFALSGEL